MNINENEFLNYKRRKDFNESKKAKKIDDFKDTKDNINKLLETKLGINNDNKYLDDIVFFIVIIPILLFSFGLFIIFIFFLNSLFP